MGAIEQSLDVLCRCLKVERCSNPEYSPCFFWDGIGRGAFLRAPRLSVSPGASHFCVDNGLLIDVAEDCLSAEVVEEIF